MTHNTLYAWSVPIVAADNGKLNNFDHTWVTDFVEDIDLRYKPDPARPAYTPPDGFWYCWGQGYEKAAKSICSADGDIIAANNISPRNVVPYEDGIFYSNTSGSIEFYGLDGVCHNVANQVLFSTGTSLKEPVRVEQAKGYAVSSFFYGTYGLNEDKWEKIRKAYMPDVKIPGDDFLPLMERFVKDKDTQLKLLELRKKARTQLAFIRTVAVAVRQQKLSQYYNIYIPFMQHSNAAILDEAEQLLGEAVFNALFQFSKPSETTWMLPL